MENLPCDITSAIGLACTVLLLASCSSSSTKGTGGAGKAGGGAKTNKELLVGKWEATKGEESMTMEFMQDGKMKMDGEHGKMVMEGNYTWADDNHIEIDYQTMNGKEFPFKGDKQKFKVTATEDELTMVDEGKGKGKGKDLKLKRVK